MMLKLIIQKKKYKKFSKKLKFYNKNKINKAMLLLWDFLIM